MSYQNLIVETRDGVAVVTINRPDKLNALNDRTVDELDAAFAAIGRRRGGARRDPHRARARRRSWPGADIARAGDAEPRSTARSARSAASGCSTASRAWASR